MYTGDERKEQKNPFLISWKKNTCFWDTSARDNDTYHQFLGSGCIRDDVTSKLSIVALTSIIQMIIHMH